FSLSFMGAGPLGALLSGYLVNALGVHLALLTPAVVISGCAVVVALRTRLTHPRRLQPMPA
ncbi:MAG TPA: hypothetical protein VLA56_11370, partial [Pseudomonadales bacterium]|nr:hypothetical protein [Pseudomonadales bacterium]